VLLSFEGRVFSGIGKGKYYVGHPEYQKRFEEVLGYRPYPGTLNLKLEDRIVIGKMKTLRSLGGKRIEAFAVGGEPMSALTCFDGTLREERVTVLFIDVTHYNESVTELISPAYLRGKYGLRDGDRVEFSAEARDLSPGRR
jgi:riboflavin kinase, archaea type